MGALRPKHRNSRFLIGGLSGAVPTLNFRHMLQPEATCLSMVLPSTFILGLKTEHNIMYRFSS